MLLGHQECWRFAFSGVDLKLQRALRRKNMKPILPV